MAIGIASAATPESWAILNRTRILKSWIPRPRYNTCFCHSFVALIFDARSEEEVVAVVVVVVEFEKEWWWWSQASAGGLVGGVKARREIGRWEAARSLVDIVCRFDSVQELSVAKTVASLRLRF